MFAECALFFLSLFFLWYQLRRSLSLASQMAHMSGRDRGHREERASGGRLNRRQDGANARWAGSARRQMLFCRSSTARDSVCVLAARAATGLVGLQRSHLRCSAERARSSAGSGLCWGRAVAAQRACFCVQCVSASKGEPRRRRRTRFAQRSARGSRWAKIEVHSRRATPNRIRCFWYGRSGDPVIVGVVFFVLAAAGASQRPFQNTGTDSWPITAHHCPRCSRAHPSIRPSTPPSAGVSRRAPGPWPAGSWRVNAGCRCSQARISSRRSTWCRLQTRPPGIV